jgi:uncharacterized protein YdeI (YjbR/CyaY-like superfamily)
MARDPRIDQYIGNAAPFAQPILSHLRELVHQACPEVEETMKWSFPHFDYKGVMISMAGFKAHCTLNLWKGALIAGIPNIDEGNTAMGNFGRITSLKDLPPDERLLEIFREAKRLNDENIRLPGKEKTKQPKELTVPDYLLEAIRANPAAQATWEKFSYSHKKEYVEWITGAKTEETRLKRLATSIEWISEGKNQMWKYNK